MFLSPNGARLGVSPLRWSSRFSVFVGGGFGSRSPKFMCSRIFKSTLKPTRHDARYQGKVSVWYPFHPFFRKHDFCVMRKFGCRDVEYLDLRCPDVRQAVPSWMVDADLCGQMTCGLRPAANLPTLLELVRWLKEHPTADL